MLVATHETQKSKYDWYAKPYCQCWNKRAPVSWKQLNACACGEDSDVSEWKWEQPETNTPSWVVVSEDKKQVTFHPFYSSGTAAVKGDTPLQHGYHYYWEIKMLTETYGTDIMVGVGTSKVNVSDSQYKFTSLLGQDGESYGLSYTGAVRHNATVARDSAGFCRGTIVGVRVDMWSGTLEFYLNRVPQGVSFYNLRRHAALFPMACSTAAQSSLRLTYAGSWRASLLVTAARALASPSPSPYRVPSRAPRHSPPRLPPGLGRTLRAHFWLTLPPTADADTMIDDDDDDAYEADNMNMMDDDAVEQNAVKMATSVLGEVLPSQYMNGFYVDNVERNYRIVLWE